MERYLDAIQYICGDSFENLGDSKTEIENIEQNDSNNSDENSDENNESDDVGEIFKKVKVDDGLLCDRPMEVAYYSSGLFENICFQYGKVPENECDESNKVSINEGYYYYCDECYATTPGKKKRTKNTSKKVTKLM